VNDLESSGVWYCISSMRYKSIRYIVHRKREEEKKEEKRRGEY
jgi:hypothetical protein